MCAVDGLQGNECVSMSTSRQSISSDAVGEHGFATELPVDSTSIPLATARLRHDPLTHLDKRLDFIPLCNSLLSHSFRHFTWVAFDSGNNGVWVRSFFRTLVQLLDHHDFFTRLAALEDDGDLGETRAGARVGAARASDSEGRGEHSEQIFQPSRARLESIP